MKTRSRALGLTVGPVVGCAGWAIGCEEAQAHLVTTGLGPVYDGVAHFAVSPEDLIPVVGLAVLAALRGPAHGRSMLFTLPVFWLLGGLAGQLTGAQMSELLPALCLLVVGGAVACDAPLLRWTAVVVTALVAAGLGYSDGTALPAGGNGVLILLGIAAAVFTVFALCVGLVLPLQSRLSRIAMRVSGSWIAASGLLLLGWYLRSGLRLGAG